MTGIYEENIEGEQRMIRERIVELFDKDKITPYQVGERLQALKTHTAELRASLQAMRHTAT